MIEGHVPPETYEAKLEAAGVPSEKPDVKQFLDNMTYDRWYLLLAWIMCLPISSFLRFGVIHLFNWARPWHELLEDQFRLEKT